jgi:transcriptional regulator with XRE-family HTH domain
LLVLHRLVSRARAVAGELVHVGLAVRISPFLPPAASPLFAVRGTSHTASTVPRRPTNVDPSKPLHRNGARPTNRHWAAAQNSIGTLLRSDRIRDKFPDMEQRGAAQNLALAEHLRTLRVDRGLTLQALAAKSDISRATLSRIENGEVSPTAETLGRLAAALTLPISQLLAPMEPGFPALLRHTEQSVWLDRNAGFSRRAVSPPSGQLKLEVIECTIEPHQRITYGLPAVSGHEHHLILLSGALSLTIDGVRYELHPGDCLRYRLRVSSCFETGARSARYIIALA